jgi:glycosyltransferase involved in cell wall biosynthesis
MFEAAPQWWLVIGSLRSGGTERQVVTLANELVRREQWVGIAVVDGRHGAAYDVDPRVTVTTLAHGGVLGAIAATLRLRRLVGDRAIVYSFLDAANLVAAAAMFGRSPRLIWGVRASDVGPSFVARLAIRLCRPLSSRVDVLIGNAAACLHFYRKSGFRPRAEAVVHNGIDLTTWCPNPTARSAVRNELGIAEDALVVGFVARVDAQKRHALLLQAFLRCGDAHLVLVGRGTDEVDGAIARQIRSLDLDKRVFALGERRDVRELTAALDVVCCASNYEGFPNTLLEGMACGVCCVASDVGGVREVLADAGVVVADDTEAAFALALLDILRDRERRSSLAAAGRARAVSLFSTAVMTDATMAAVAGVR